MTRQHTLQSSVSSVGVGLHTGASIRLSLHPAGEGTGIVFRRTDLQTVRDIPARVTSVVDARLATTLGVGNHTISTVEHVMAALSALGVDNAFVDVDGPEIPVMDGSAQAWVSLIEEAGLRRQSKARMYLCMRDTVEVVDGDKRASLAPADHYEVHCAIDFKHPLISRQTKSLVVTGETFKQQLCDARTFGFNHEVEQLRKMGLARGGSLANAVVLDQERILNPEGLRHPDEFVRHKILDAVGDMHLVGGPIAVSYTHLTLPTNREV